MMQAVVVGAGPGGLAVSRELNRRRMEHVVIERGERPGQSWAEVYDTLRLHTGKHLSALPGRPFPRSAPLFLSAADFLAYLGDYAASMKLPIETGREALRAVREEGRWVIETTAGTLYARSLVIATGIMSSPVVPHFDGRDAYRGTVTHSVTYRRPDPYVGRRVLVVGAGNSAAEIAPELAGAGAAVTVAVRSGANVVPRTVLGVPIQYVAWAVLGLPAAIRPALVGAFAHVSRMAHGRPPFPSAEGPLLGEVPIIGFKLVHAIREGRIRLKGGIRSFTRGGVRFADGTEDEFDDVILATGFRAALGPVEAVVTRDEHGFARRRDRVVSADQPDLYFVGHHYDGTGGIHNISRDAPVVAALVAGKGVA